MNEELIEKKAQRPVVITILAVVMFLNGILTIVNAISFEAQPIVYVMGGVALLLSVGLWMLWSWAWAGTILLQLVAVGFAIYDWFTGGPIDVLAMALGAIIIVYLLRAEVRAVFLKDSS
ncbi:MAG: hypothetical protein R3293_15690 [Candidatus Promineifilaceae bacterium]|nr:hypothetical protein [Candidatus Promineifilaceae bacterium]